MATGLSLILFVFLLILLSLGIWVAPALITLGYILLEFFTPAPVGSLLASTLWDASWNWALTALPLFIWMGEILFRTRLSSEMFKGLAPMLSNLPGGLLHVNVVGCGIMAAVAGSSAVTCATIGRMSIPELKKRNYDETLSIGSLAGSGTLGLLIPPSIMLIVYGVLAQVSISRFFIAGVLPGIMIIIIFMTYIIIRSKLNPALAPKQDIKYTFWEKIKAARNLLPVLALIFFVLGSIYGGYATPTEAATIGVIGALLLAWSSKTLNKQSFVDSLMGAVKTSCMINFIIVGAGLSGLHLSYCFLKDEYFKDYSFLIIDKEKSKKEDNYFSYWEIGDGKWDSILKNKQAFQLTPYVDEDMKVPQGLAGNSAYFIKPEGAEQMISLVYKYGMWPNDALMCRQLVNGLGVTRKFYTKVQGLKSTTTRS